MVNAWVLARSDRAGSWRFFAEALASDLHDVPGRSPPPRSTWPSYRGHWGINLHLTPDRLWVRVPASCAAPVRIGVKGEVVELVPGSTREFPC